MTLFFGLGLLINVIGAILGIQIFEALGLWPVNETPGEIPLPGDG